MDAGLWIYSAGKALRHPGGFAAPQRQAPSGHLLLHGQGQTFAPHQGDGGNGGGSGQVLGVDPEKARRAAILHDCTKYWDLETQVAACDKYGIALDELERVSVKFLHAKTGAALAKYVFGEPDDVYDAIFCHTTGKPGMTKLDKVLYLADYMEPSRAFDGVEELRRLVWEDLDQAMILGLEMTVEELRERGAVVHQNTQGTLDDLRRKLR
ncbi:MAG: bis(5'-nucleosyl)-tetraphosphatase (symmetrical) YqeK [Evtepia gabavorous]